MAINLTDSVCNKNHTWYGTIKMVKKSSTPTAAYTGLTSHSTHYNSLRPHIKKNAITKL